MTSEPTAPEPWLAPPAPLPAVPRDATRAEADEPPVVRVTIGRVDVRAVLPPTPPEQPKQRRRPRMSLDEYLRNGGRP